MGAQSSGIVSRALAQGFLVDSEAFDLMQKLPPDLEAAEVLQKVIQKKLAEPKSVKMITREDVEAFLPETLTQNEVLVRVPEIESEIDVVFDPTSLIAPMDAEEGYKRLFKDRYERLLAIVKRRPDTRNATTIQAAKGVAPGQKLKVAALVSSRNTKRGNVELWLDDPTGSLRLSFQEGPVSRMAEEVPLDSMVVAEVSRSKSGQLYPNSLTLPDIPDRKPVTASHRVYAVLLSDLHVGSKMFLREDFERFILWLNGKLGDEEIVNRIKYIVIAGDVVDGVGVYPGQEIQLSERDLRKQYLLASQFIERIPRHIQVLVSPGNHDAVRQALPQPAVPVALAEGLYNLENVKWIGNPAYVRLHGVGILVYHGKSLDDIIATTPGLSYSKPTIAMELLLRARHLAPTYGKRTALSPEMNDLLVVDSVPDVLHSGHVHSFDVSNYRGTLIVNSGTWQGQTSFQANMGLEPTPSIIPIVDLSMLTVIRRNFGSESFSLSP
ncbi:MAG: DNA-directed DNA polymerase II small subunit [Thaumarchaeota archaeon]|nr:DNA-directed DNA polymerase II small subunit [Nitrososphaerota archaeon]